MLKMILLACFILLIITILLIVLLKNRRQNTEIYSLQAFLGSQSYELQDEKTKSFIEAINDFFNEPKHQIPHGQEDFNDEGNDAGE